MGVDPISTTTSEYLLTQGVLGITTLLPLGAVIYLWRENKVERKQFDQDVLEERNRSATELLAERNRHAVEIAAERKLNAELQEARMTELRAALDAVRSVTSTVDSAILVLRGRDV